MIISASLALAVESGQRMIHGARDRHLQDFGCKASWTIRSEGQENQKDNDVKGQMISLHLHVKDSHCDI